MSFILVELTEPKFFLFINGNLTPTTILTGIHMLIWTPIGQQKMAVLARQGQFHEWPFQKNGQSYRGGFKARDYTISTYRHCPLKAKMLVKSTSEAWTDKSSVKHY